MGISVSYRGSQAAAERRAEAFAYAREFAHDMLWRVDPLTIAPEGRVVLGDDELIQPEIEGLTLLPHFACDPLPLVFESDRGTLVDAFIKAEGEVLRKLWEEPLVKTQFAGAAVHREVCEFLRGLIEYVPELSVDDESGYFQNADPAGLDRAIEDGWRAVVAAAREGRALGTESFEVGGQFFSAEAGVGQEDPHARIGPDRRQLLEQLIVRCAARYGGFGLDLDGTIHSLENLDLIMQEADDDGTSSDHQNPETEEFVHGVGAYFGGVLVRHFGAGHWVEDPEEGLQLTDLGGTGLVVNPFQVATDRLVSGPAFGFEHHFRLYAELIRRLGARA